MRFVLIAGLIGLSLAAVSGERPAALWETYRQLYPSEPGQRQALDRCFLMDSRFDRFDPAARAECYRKSGVLRDRASLHPGNTESIGPKENFVDLWRAAGQGRLPPNDVRTTERNEHYLQLLAAGRSH